MSCEEYNNKVKKQTNNEMVILSENCPTLNWCYDFFFLYDWFH